ncbi:MAG TPA: radical SAM family heme chaperone HemW, partial [Phnomibacter sp.]|nr:radical SAM family heme chaperone HemW [Phnomibacter sp.]
MAGVYVHIPYCKQACTYCNFHFSTRLQQMPQMVLAMVQQIKNGPLPASIVPQTTAQTVYLGGGTPSLLPERELLTIMEALHQRLAIDPQAEVTLEANPDDITAPNLMLWRQAGINRLSIGVQSFFDAHLQFMNRAHNAGQAEYCIAQAQDAGFANLSIDLIYGTPGLTDAQWLDNLAKATGLQVPHISSYALTVGEKTALYHLVKTGKSAAPAEDVQAWQFEQLSQVLGAAGYEHYETSNLAKPGWRSRHNSSYWQGKAYLGFGPGAHSFDGYRTRWWGLANNALYLKLAMANEVCWEAEKLTDAQRVNEVIMTQIRLAEGLAVDLD